jgi:quinol monooxygenase YgiN
MDTIAPVGSVGQEERMHAAVRIYQVDPGSVDEFKRLVNETFLPTIKEAPGFQAYYSLDTGDGRIASVSVFDDRAGAEASTKMAADNIRQNMASVAPIPPEVLEGEVFATEGASAGPISGVTDTLGGATQPVSGVTDTVGGATGNLLGGGEKKS